MDSAWPRRALLRQWRFSFTPYLPGTLAPPAPRHWGLTRKAMYYTFSKRCGTIFFWLVGYVGAVKLFLRVAHGLAGNTGAITSIFRVAHGGLFAMPKYLFVVWLIRVLIISAWITAYET